MDRCPVCGSKEISSCTPRTVYECGSSDYNQRTDTFRQSEACKTFTNITNILPCQQNQDIIRQLCHIVTNNQESTIQQGEKYAR